MLQIPDNAKNIGLFPTNKGVRAYEMLKNDEDYSNAVALDGFNEHELKELYEYLVRIRKNIEPDWETVKKGGNRKYKKIGLEQIDMKNNKEEMDENSK